MPHGLATVSELIDAEPSARIVALAVLDTKEEVLACIEAGAIGYIPREATADDLIATVESVARGEAIVPPRMVASILRRVTTLAGGTLWDFSEPNRLHVSSNS